MNGSRRRHRLFVLAVVAVLLGAGLLVGGSVLATDGSDGGVSTFDLTNGGHTGAMFDNVTLSGDGYNETQYEIVANHHGMPYVWQDGELNVSVTVDSRDNSGGFVLNGAVYNEEGEDLGSFDNESFNMNANSTNDVSLSLSSWPENATGNHTIMIELYRVSTGDNELVFASTIEVIVIERDGDLTGDGLTNEQEFELGTDFTRPDTSGNGLTDWQEAMNYGTDPLREDTTGDGIKDATLVRLGLDPTEPYLLHRYGAGALLSVLALAATVVVARRRMGGTDVRRTGPTEPTQAAAPDATPGGQERNGDGSTIDESILTNEELVRKLLSQHGGRMKQTQIVESTDWSKAKVSRVLSELEDQGVVERIRIGRENVVDLDEELPEQSDPPA